MKRNRRRLLALLCASITFPLWALAQKSGQAAPIKWEKLPETRVTVDGSEAMFTTMCALLAAGFEADVSAENWSPMRAQLRDRLQHQQGPAVEVLRNFYRQHELADPGALLSRYIWFGLVSGPAPNFVPTLRRDELPPEILALEGFQEILAAYYKEQKIGVLWRQVQPIYDREIEKLHDSVADIVFVSSGYLREILEPGNPRTFTIVVEPLVGRITNVRNFGDHYSLVLSGSDALPVDVVRHAFLHFLLDPLPLMYPHVVAVKRPVYDLAARAPRLSSELKDDLPSYFAECMVRAVELKLKRLSPGERESAMDLDDASGLVLVRPLFASLAKFEQAEPCIRLFFPDLVRAIDEPTEEKRVAAIRFAEVQSAATSEATEAEAVARRRAAPTTVPNDAEVIANLTEGERRIAEKNPRAAESSFQRVLVKYPDQPRAIYGLGLVALLEHDGTRAKELFGRLTTGEHVADKDPMVLAWSHIYLARILDDEGQRDQAKSEYQAALAVQGGPEQARQAASKGLAAMDVAKPVERP
jgi:tetratricopeptide (TPR) repeat protein